MSLDTFLVYEELQEAKNALLDENIVPPENSPYLVTSSKYFMWIDVRKEKPILRSAWRKVEDLKNFLRNIVKEIYEANLRQKWQGIFPYSKEGLASCLEHLKYYGFEELEIWCNSESKVEVESWSTDREIQDVDFLPQNFFMVIPKNKEYVGVLQKNPVERYNLVIHNASRGFAFGVEDDSAFGEVG